MLAYKYIVSIPETVHSVSAMKADTEYKKELAKATKTKIGMDAMPIMIFSRLLNYYMAHGKLREAMFIVCMANWGSRFSDTVRVRFCHIFDENGNFRDSFMLNGGEQKTGKQNIYYNNEAIRIIVTAYLAENPREYYDYLFVSESRNKARKTLREIEIEEKFGDNLSFFEEKIREVREQKSSVINLYAKGILTEKELEDKLNEIRRNEERYTESIVDTKRCIENYTCTAPNISIQMPMTRAVAENFIKAALKELNIITENRIDKTDDINLQKKFNTHSFRKLFAEEFYRTGKRLSDEDILDFDAAMFKLVQDKLMHSKNKITQRYNSEEESAFRLINMDMNLGMDVLKKYC